MSTARAACLLAMLLAAGCAPGMDETPGDADAVAGPGGGTAQTGGGGGGAPEQGGGGGIGAAGGGGGEPWQPVETEWCAGEGWIGLSEDVCFFAPASPTARLLFYAHGMMPPDSSAKTQQDIVRAAAEAHGFVAVFPRGRQGLCSWDPSVESWWCWPTSREAVDAHAPELIEQWSNAEALLASILGSSFEARYVMGFSNGGYWVTYLGLEGLIEAEGYGLVGAGRSYVDESLLADARPPFYIAVGALELDSVKSSAQNLAFVLSQNDWPHALIEHPNQGHEIHESDFDLAWDTWAAP